MNELTIKGPNLILKHENEQLKNLIEENINHFKSFDNILYDTAINCHNGKALNLLLEYNINECNKIVNSPNFNTSNLKNLLRNDFKISTIFLEELFDSNKSNVTEFLPILIKNVKIKNCQYQVIIDKAIQNNNVQVLSFFMKYYPHYSLLINNIYFTPKKLKSLINHGFVVTVPMAIDILCQNNALEYIEVIIENIIHYDNDTIMKFLFHYKNNQPISKIMLEEITFKEIAKLENILYGENENGETVLKVVFNKLVDELHNEPITFDISLLIRNNIGYQNVNEKINDYIKIIINLIEHGADIYVTNKDRETLMTVALDYRIKPLIECLLECGIDINEYNENGETPFYTCCRKEIEYTKNKSSYNTVYRNEIECTKSNKKWKRKGISNCNDLAKNYLIESQSINNYLIELGADINKCNYEGLSPLHLACIHNNESMTRNLVELGANVNIKDSNNETPLIKVCQTENESLIDYLVEHGADVNAKDVLGETPLIKACQNANESIIKYLIEHGADVNAINVFGETSLIKACQTANESIIKYLIERGANINAKDELGETPLIKACQNANESLIKYLEEHGADMNVKNNIGENPLEIAINYQNISIIEYLVERNAITDISEKSMENLLMIACENEYITIIKQLIEQGVNINKHNDDYIVSIFTPMKLRGFCPLTVACRTGYLSIISYLIRKGADVHGCSDCVDTPLTAACAHNDKSLIVYLVLKGADVNQCNKYGSTPLIIACQNNNESIVQYLVEQGANVNAIDNDNLSPLIIACQQGNESIVQYLVKRGANVNQYDSRGNPLLFIAGEQGNLPLIRYLIQQGANINAKNYENENILMHIINIYNNKINNSHDIFSPRSSVLTFLRSINAIVDYLIKHGININEKNNEGDTALSIACRYHCKDIVQQLAENDATINDIDKLKVILICARENNVRLPNRLIKR